MTATNTITITTIDSGLHIVTDNNVVVGVYEEHFDAKLHAKNINQPEVEIDCKWCEETGLWTVTADGEFYYTCQDNYIDEAMDVAHEQLNGWRSNNMVERWNYCMEKYGTWKQEPIVNKEWHDDANFGSIPF